MARVCERGIVGNQINQSLQSGRRLVLLTVTLLVLSARVVARVVMA